jgi:hypothetical protein
LPQSSLKCCRCGEAVLLSGALNRIQALRLI